MVVWGFGFRVGVVGNRRVPASAGIRCAPCAPPSFRFAPRKGLVARALTLGTPLYLSFEKGRDGYLPFGKGKDGVMRARLVAKGAEVG